MSNNDKTTDSPAGADSLNRLVRLWLCGKITHQQWELVGVFDSEERAVQQCRDEFHFVGSIVLNAVAPKETVELPGGYYPLANVHVDARIPASRDSESITD
jgi:hypothetical protein